MTTINIHFFLPFFKVSSSLSSCFKKKNLLKMKIPAINSLKEKKYQLIPSKIKHHLLLNDYLRNLRGKIIHFGILCFYQILF